MTLDQLKPGSEGVITAVGGEGALRRRLLDMGLTPKTRILVRKVAPMGDPIELFVRGYVLTLRAQDAANIDLADGAPDDFCSGDCKGCRGGRKAEAHGEQGRRWRWRRQEEQTSE